jgi:2-polyprenyl-3-methyl-5-hydroxy-6-metoxy-1,4-benzoquinol methylase
MSQWFESWFDSAYYHKLYFNRDENEALRFINNLMDYLKPKPQSFMLDIACGKGRHSKTLATYNQIVTGIDISPQSIACAKQFESDNLEFFQHDMRLTFRINYYNYAFNLFTSFGYFNTHRENDDALRTITQGLKPGGTFVFDYLNTNYVEANLVPSEAKEIDGTTFRIKRYKTASHFIKQIQVEDVSLALPMLHQEQVAALTLTDFEKMFAKQGLHIKQVFGSYNLEAYDTKTSKRLIIVAQKN